MRGKVFLVQWNVVSAKARAGELRSDGWTVDVESEDGGRAYKLIKANPPDIVLIDISRKLSHDRELAFVLRNVKATRNIPIIFVDGKEEAAANLRNKVPDAVFTTSYELKKALVKFAKSG